ncbi:MAG: helix-turn-helix transcriptional regulator [Clostridia bacterium]|nr:helix-turn-helix transcriptional regulator [Clostridia bacterium]
MKNEFSKNITELRMQKGWSQKETASKLGISQALLSHYEKGIRECGLDFLIKISELYGCTTDYLLGISSVPRTPSESDADNITADLREYPMLIKSREEVSDTLNILYSITARIGNPEINKSFNNLLGNTVFSFTRKLEKLYFNQEIFSFNKDLTLANAERKKTTAFYSLAREMQDKSINVNLKKIRIEEDYPTRSKSFFNLISHFDG